MLPSAPKEQPVVHETEGDLCVFSCHATCLVLCDRTRFAGAGPGYYGESCSTQLDEDETFVLFPLVTITLQIILSL